ncbi:enoyl-CoA hydratase-related protein [Dermatophilaceae bacterium Sec6.4]
MTTPPAPQEHPVVLTLVGGVATVRLNRPTAMNALNLAVKESLLATLQELSADAKVRVVVLTGTGRAFCVGQDLNEHVAQLRSGQILSSTVVQHYNPIMTLLHTMDKPVIAAVNGVAAGAGASLAFAADARFVADTAGFNTSFAAIGLSSDTGASWTLPRLVGYPAARELLMFPRTVPAEEAQRLGLVTRLVPAAELDATVAEYAAQLATGPTLAYASIRQAVAYSAGHSLADSLANEAELMARTGASGDHLAAVEAFLSKTPPTFTGQ